MLAILPKMECSHFHLPYFAFVLSLCLGCLSVKAALVFPSFLGKAVPWIQTHCACVNSVSHLGMLRPTIRLFHFMALWSQRDYGGADTSQRDTASLRTVNTSDIIDSKARGTDNRLTFAGTFVICVVFYKHIICQCKSVCNWGVFSELHLKSLAFYLFMSSFCKLLKGLFVLL